MHLKQSELRKNLYRFSFAFVVLLCVGVLSIQWGAVSDLPWEDKLQLRMPRVLISVMVGAALAVSGTALQAIFRNPLCDPYTLGVSSGAGLGAVLGLSLGIGQSWMATSGMAFLGSVGFTFLLLLASRTQMSMATLLLTGVMLSFLGSSMISLWMVLTDPLGLMGALQWLLGDLSRARLEWVGPFTVSVFFMTFLLWKNHRTLDALMLGEEEARALGLDVEKNRRKLIFLTAFLIGSTVSAVGMIGFIGLVVPHLARKMVGSLHRRLIPQAAILGSIFLVTSDLASRLVMRPLEIPVGILAAFIGAPFFVWVLVRERAGR